MKEWHICEKKEKNDRNLCDGHLDFGCGDPDHCHADKFLFDHKGFID